MKKLTLATLLFLFSVHSFAESSINQFSESEKRNYYVRAKGYSSNPEPDPPRYVNQLNQTGIEEFKDIDWIDIGLTHRIRFEHRDNDYRRAIDTFDNPILLRTQAYFGIKNILDPIRFAFEFQDSRRFNSQFGQSTGDINKLEMFQAYSELYFKNPVMFDRPVSLRAGRMAFEVIDRKLLSRDDWGNTGTNFQGYRAIIGEKEDDWQFDSFALRPMTKLTDENDQENQNQWLYAAILNWRRWSDITTIQPFYFKLGQKRSAISNSRKIDSPGLRLHGTFGDSGFDYGLIGVYQFGESESKKHRASAYAAEFGYTQNHAWKPRYSLVYGYASGDKNPNDNKNQRFERLYGFNRAWSNSNHIEWENLKTVKSRIEFQPHKKFRAESSYSFYWLASSTDSWRRGNNLRDRTGRSGTEIGQDFDLRLHYEVSKHLFTTLGYAHFRPGKFTRNVGRDDSSDFIYLELNFSLFAPRK